MIDDGIGYGHLQLVHGANEIEVQASDLVTLGNWVFPNANSDRSHQNYTPYYSDPDNYSIIEVDVSIQGSDRTADDVWEVFRQAHRQFAAQASISYDIDQNSNTYIATLLGMVGINVSGYANQLASNISSVFSFRGSEHNSILQEYSIDFTLDGGDHDDFLRTGTGEDTLSGLDGEDELYGGTGNDELKGGDDNDQLFGQDDYDTLIGGRGNDLLDGGDGFDTADYSAAADPDTTGRTTGITVTQNAQTGTGIVNDGLGGTDTLVSIEFINGTSFDDSFAVTGSLAGVGGESQLQFDGGANGENGDTLNLSGVTSGGLTVVLQTAGDAGYATHSTGFPGFFSGDAEIAFGGIENVVGSNSNDTITGSEASNILYGGDGADSLSGGAGDDIYSYPAGAEKCWEANCIKNITIAFSIFIAGINPVYAETIKDISVPLACSHFTPDADYIDFTLVMRLEEREVKLRVPQEFLEDQWNRQQDARLVSMLFTTLIDTFEPVTRSQTPYLDFEYTTFLINDYIALPKLAELMLDMASPGKASPSEPLSAYDTRPFQYGLIEVIPNYPKELQKNVYLQMGQNGTVNTVIACSTPEAVPYPTCQQFSRTVSGVDIKFHYPIRFLPIWQEMQNNIHSFIECAISEANKERQ